MPSKQLNLSKKISCKDFCPVVGAFSILKTVFIFSEKFLNAFKLTWELVVELKQWCHKAALWRSAFENFLSLKRSSPFYGVRSSLADACAKLASWCCSTRNTVDAGGFHGTDSSANPADASLVDSD